MALTAACAGGDGSSGDRKATETARSGGTLDILFLADFEHLDPQRNYVLPAMEFGSRLLYRTLTAYDSKPGPAGSRIVPDLATDLGRPSNHGMTWEFTLKTGVRFENGAPIVCADVKYGVERSFSRQITDGPKYAQAYLADTEGYPGPYVQGDNRGVGLPSITCKDSRTIVFQLAHPVGDFNYTVTLPQFSPVPKAKDTGVAYDNRPFSSGPYEIETYVRGKSITLVRNPYWDPKTDPVRKAYPDKVHAVFGLDPAVIDQRLIADSPPDQTALMLDSFVQPEDLQSVLGDRSLRKRLVTGLSGYVRYLAINTAKVRDIRVREAIEYAIDKEAYRRARGGASAGAYATTMITPLMTSHKDFDVYRVPPAGDQATARALLTEAGALGSKLTIDFADTPTNAESAAAFQRALDKSGFVTSLKPIDVDVYFSTIGNSAGQDELVLAGWGPDWTNGSSVIPPLFDGRRITIRGNENYAQLDDPEINKLIDDANLVTDLHRQAALWGDLDQKVMEKAAVVPLIYDRTNQLVGSKVKGGFLHSFYGQTDLATLSVG